MQVKGFTLLETGLVLMIGCLLIFIGFSVERSTVAALREENFFRELRAEWSSEFYRALQKNYVVDVVFFTDRVSFYQGDKPDKVILYPKTLQHLGYSQQYLLDGTLALRPQTETFRSTLGKEYSVRFQLGYGGQYRIVEKKVER